MKIVFKSEKSRSEAFLDGIPVILKRSYQSEKVKKRMRIAIYRRNFHPISIFRKHNIFSPEIRVKDLIFHPDGNKYDKQIAWRFGIRVTSSNSYPQISDLKDIPKVFRLFSFPI